MKKSDKELAELKRELQHLRQARRNYELRYPAGSDMRTNALERIDTDISTLEDEIKQLEES